MLATVVVLWVGKAARVISFPDCDESIPRKVRKLSISNYVHLLSQYSCIYFDLLLHRHSLYLCFIWGIRSLAY